MNNSLSRDEHIKSILNFSKYFFLLSLQETMILHPIFCNNWIAHKPTPPAPAWTRTVILEVIFAICLSEYSTVNITEGNVDASIYVILFGILTIKFSCVIVLVFKHPFNVTPITRSPILYFNTFLPILTTLPAKSVPTCPASPG